MKGSATVLMGIAVITRTSASPRALSTPSEHQAVGDSRHHADVVSLGSLDPPLCPQLTTKNVAAANGHSHFNSFFMQF